MHSVAQRHQSNRTGSRVGHVMGEILHSSILDSDCDSEIEAKTAIYFGQDFLHHVFAVCVKKDISCLCINL